MGSGPRSETGVPKLRSYSSEVAEKSLAHIVKNRTEAAYLRGDLLDKRRQLMGDLGKIRMRGQVEKHNACAKALLIQQN